MNYLSAENISKSYGERWLFKNLNFGISQGQRVALVGVNGSGKTTLLNVLAGKIPPDEGSVSMRKEVTIGFLGQNPEFDENLTVHQTIFSGQSEALDVIRDYEIAIENPDTSAEKMQHLMERMDELQAWDFELKVKQILSKLGIHNLEDKISHLSGGQRKRVAMARVLIDEPSMLILDEPTNHLDLDTIEWLENLLSTQNTTLLMVTHDRYFLDRVANEIAELDGGQVFSYKGNYSYFVEKKASREEMAAAETEKARNLMRKELDWIRRQPKARGTKAKYRVDAFEELKEKAAKKVSGPQLELSVKTTRQGGKIIEVDHISKSFGSKKIVDDFSYVFKKKDRIGIVGPNGAGKSTFLNMLTGKLQPDAGTIDAGQTTVFGYYTQEELQFKEGQRVIDIAKEIAEVVEMANGEVITASQFLQHFQFAPAQQYTMVNKLSGGEKRRLQLLRVLIKNPNFLILDEPTNDLDIITLNILEDFLLNFGGCLLMVSHDRYFMDRLVEHLFVFEGEGKIRNFPGNYTDYREWLKDQEKQEPETKTIVAAPAPVQARKEEQPTNKRKATFNEKKEYEQLEKEIAKLEARKTEVIGLMNAGTTTDHAQLSAWATEIEEINEQLEEKEFRWLELAEII
ncbi:ABC-F family ATP-binding cassette domain-containing protein [Pontibacter sp. BT310]|uniref:ABC-F family ATP-binding cassette domain-containing protein n=1 Tax=Pontibacter populi TaxID=890055 RepID=A0ABS6X6B0_9BACT|nr:MULTISPECIES: ABC-F family ATP-binding cassette domain-containing protein [Pontibacter]MBJ6116681.1 ABC-F family ATP-binding cassette domain-containing protein [Pontibacter sp. BT310]MBR0569105.1 ABC-F family ATP-binding cassette domain-containing protein [Microvirga sp. STS03]MBW3363535.1 ABC-F family ATP-binding cassette domain-containing protein [Pontibacter populi]